MKKSYNVGIYCRLSREDVKNGKRDISLSIENQQAMLEMYVDNEGWNLCKAYIDDDFSGTNFNRPGFQAMMADIETGIINCVITKDLSRLGRNYIEAGLHRELFAEHGVRYIAILDNHDSLNNDCYDITTPIKEMMNEMYAADCSRKGRSAKRLMAEQGKFSNSRAPYGYKKSPENKHVLVVDENVAYNVARIFELYLSGKPARAIAAMFSREKIATPNEYYYSTIKKPNPYNRTNTDKWNSGSIMNIIKNPAYYGAMSNGKRKVVSFKNHNVVRQSTDKWIIVEDTHEPIISKDLWLEAQQVNRQNTKQTVRRSADGEVSVFAGLIKCADCGGNMALKRRPNKTVADKEFYRCSTYVQKGKDACSVHAIDFNVLSEAVLSDIQRYAALAVEDEKKLIDRIIHANGAFQNKNTVRFEKSIRESENRIKEIDGILKNLYEDKLSGEITANIFKRMAQKFSEEQTKLTAGVEQLRCELIECQRVQRDISELIKRVKEYLTIGKLTRAIVVELIDRIEVSESYNASGECNIDIAINYKFGRIEKEPAESPPSKKTFRTRSIA